MAPKARGGKAKDESELLTALRFIKIAQYASDDLKAQAAYQSHCWFTSGQVIGFNGVLAAGYPCLEEMHGCPNTVLFIKALEKIRGAYSLTLLNNHQLAISSNVFRALVPCIPPHAVEHIAADPGYWDMGDEWKRAAVEAGTFSADGAQTVLGASVVSLSHSLVGTNGSALVEAWHGFGMPSGLLIPMAFVDAIAKIPHKLIKFGYTENQSLTFYFENGAWLRTQLYQEGVPNVERVLNELNMSSCTAIPPEFYAALDAVSPFCETSSVVIDTNSIRSHDTKDKGASHLCDGLPFTRTFNHQWLAKIRAFVHKVDFTTYEDKVVFVGDKVRVVLMAMR